MLILKPEEGLVDDLNTSHLREYIQIEDEHELNKEEFLSKDQDQDSGFIFERRNSKRLSKQRVIEGLFIESRGDANGSLRRRISLPDDLFSDLAISPDINRISPKEKNKLDRDKESVSPIILNVATLEAEILGGLSPEKHGIQLGLLINIHNYRI